MALRFAPSPRGGVIALGAARRAMTLGRARRRVVPAFPTAGVSFGHGTGNAFDEAAWLVTWSLGLPLDALETKGKRPVSDDEKAAVDALIKRRASKAAVRPRTSPAKPGCRTSRSPSTSARSCRARTWPSCSSTSRRPARSTPGSPTQRSGARSLHRQRRPRRPGGDGVPGDHRRRVRCFRRRARGRPHRRRPAWARQAHRHRRVGPVHEASRALRPRPLQPADRRRRQHGGAPPRSTAPSRPSRSPAAPTAWT